MARLNWIKVKTTISSQAILFPKQFCLTDIYFHKKEICMYSFIYVVLLSLGLEFQHKLFSLFSEKLISWNYESLWRINFHLRTLIFIFALNSHLQFIFDSSNGFLWTLSADTEFPWEDRYRIKTDQPFSENVAVQLKAWNKWPFKCVVRDYA